MATNGLVVKSYINTFIIGRGNHYSNKTKDEFKVNGKFRQRLIKTGTVDQHTPEYKAKLKALNIELPKKAFYRDTPNFVVDITKLPITILKDYGFIK